MVFDPCELAAMGSSVAAGMRITRSAIASASSSAGSFGCETFNPPVLDLHDGHPPPHEHPPAFRINLSELASDSARSVVAEPF
jgi:hypothetical protein